MQTLLSAGCSLSQPSEQFLPLRLRNAASCTGHGGCQERAAQTPPCQPFSWHGSGNHLKIQGRSSRESVLSHSAGCREIRAAEDRN